MPAPSAACFADLPAAKAIGQIAAEAAGLAAATAVGKSAAKAAVKAVPTAKAVGNFGASWYAACNPAAGLKPGISARPLLSLSDFPNFYNILK